MRKILGYCDQCKVYKRLVVSRHKIFYIKSHDQVCEECEKLRDRDCDEFKNSKN